MSQIFHDVLWEIELPTGWSSEQDEDCSSFFAEDGVGALQISDFLKSEAVTDEDLQELAEEHNLRDLSQESQEREVRSSRVQFNTLTGFHIDFCTDGEYWRQWWLRCGQIMIFATYNCTIDKRGVEDEQIDKILSTLQCR
jgi:hypothetical protein